jgi:hypothetical protein
MGRRLTDCRRYLIHIRRDHYSVEHPRAVRMNIAESRNRASVRHALGLATNGLRGTLDPLEFTTAIMRPCLPQPSFLRTADLAAPAAKAGPAGSA